MAAVAKRDFPPVEADAPVPPSFDVVRADAAGGLVVAGKAASGWTVKLKVGKRVLKEEKADASGAWVMMVDAAPEVDNGALALSATSPTGEKSVEGVQTVPLPKRQIAKQDSARPQIATAGGAAAPGAGSSEATGAKPGHASSAGAADAGAAPVAGAAGGPATALADAAGGDLSRQAAQAGQAGKAAGTGGDQPTGREEYTVSRGDTLWGIAKKYYGDGSKYRKIYRANRRKIGDPDLIYPDQRFVVSR